MRVAITGVSGYLGQLVARELDADPAVEQILGLDLVPSKFSSPRFSFARADVLTADFQKLLRGTDVFIHLAFIVTPPDKKLAARIDQINVEGSRRAFREAARAGVTRIIYSSSIAAYGAHPDNPEFLREDAPLRPNPDWYYSRTKGAVEKFLDEFQSEQPGLRIIRFRPSIFLGPTLTNPMTNLYTSRVLADLNPGLKVAFTWDADVASAFRPALRHEKSDSFNLSGDGPLTTGELGRLLRKPVLRLPPRLALPPLRAAARLGLLSREQFEWVESGTRGSITVSTEKARKTLGWQPRFDSAGAVLEFVRQSAKIDTRNR
ncbi:MAG: NAD-dependent epimerase/dehydratase family protein [bacterium]|nr:NAD-dependent epimerase/dehydratase family protein [bacterium]